jgi:hypothetical protein
MNTDTDMEDLLAAARTAPREVPAELLGRVLADAYALQPQSVVLPSASKKGPGLFTRLFSAMGGAAGLAGLGAAALGGVWIGFSQPAPIVALTDQIWSGSALESVELIPDLSTFMTEG